MRGEQVAVYSTFVTPQGSPPLARGTGRIARYAVPALGITPACAGNRAYCTLRRSCAGDHPRLRGEQAFNLSYLLGPMGSPPLARGTDYHIHSGRICAGITPACAGNSMQNSAVLRCLRDHPRLRGEQVSTLFSLRLIWGSPPLARGTGARCSVRVLRPGITPACAGNRASGKASPPQGWDHPRLRGEQIKLCLCAYVAQGSPPLARGTGFSRCL